MRRRCFRHHFQAAFCFHGARRGRSGGGLGLPPVIERGWKYKRLGALESAGTGPRIAPTGMVTVIEMFAEPGATLQGSRGGKCY